MPSSSSSKSKSKSPEASNRRVIDFHTHTFNSDGVLGVAEMARRCLVSGYKILGLADHVDQSSMDRALAAALRAAAALNGYMDDLVIIPGVELTHLPPAQIAGEVKRARELGAAFVVVHGESVAEPVAPGTNLAAIKAGADILAHPGLLTDREAALAAERGVYLELSGRGGHGLANGLVANLARKHGARLLINSDGHAPGDYLTPDRQRKVALGAGLSEKEFTALMAGAEKLAEKLAGRPA